MLLVLEAKFIKYFEIENMTKLDFAFLIHPRQIEDFYRKFPIAQVLPKSFLEFSIKFLKPFVVAKINGIQNKKHQKLTGYIIGVPLTAKQIIQFPQLAIKRVIEAINLAENLGVGIVGLGALTSSVTKGGELIKDRVNISVTTGNSLTAAITYEDIKWLLEKNRLNVKSSTIGVVGATGSIGQAVCKLLLMNQLSNNFILIARNKENLERLFRELKRLSPTAKIIPTTQLQEIKRADIIVVTTSAAQALLHSQHLKERAIVYDITQPRNVSPQILKERPDVTIIDGGLVKMPDYVQLTFQMGLPKGTTFSCLAETMILAMEGMYENFSIGTVEVEKSLRINHLRKKYGFSNIPIFSFSKRIY